MLNAYGKVLTVNRFNRYIVECKYKVVHTSDKANADLIDT